MTSKLRFGIIGCGDFASSLSGYLLEVADIVALCDLNAGNTAALAKSHDLSARHYTNYAALLQDGGLDAVAITAANFAHRDVACAAAEAGIHVYCEKAMARTVPECWDMVRACQENGVRLMVGHKRRLRPPWSRMIELTDQSLLGDPLALTVTQYADMRPYDYQGTWWADPAKSGGPFALLGVHVIDWFAAMCGEPESVSAFYGEQIESGYKFPDVVHATYRFRSGALATISTSFMFPLRKFREAQGPMVQCRHGGLMLEPQMDEIHLRWQRLDEDEPHVETYPVMDDFPPAYRREIGDFARWITADDAPCLTWREGLRCVQMMEAAYRSAEQMGRPVEIENIL